MTCVRWNFSIIESDDDKRCEYLHQRFVTIARVFFFFFCGKKLFFGKVLIERRFLPHSANLRDINRKTKPDLRRCLIGGAIMNSTAHQHVKEIRSSRREKNPTRQSLTINYGFQLGRFFLRTQSRVRECFKLIKTV